MDKSTIITLLHKHIAQRSGIDGRNYGNRESFMEDYHRILRHGKQARILLRQVELRGGITASHMLAHLSTGRLVVRDGECEYCTGQDFPTEYRGTACRALASMLWDFWREDGMTGDDIRKIARKQLGRSIAHSWFN